MKKPHRLLMISWSCVLFAAPVAPAQERRPARAVTVTGDGPETWVLFSGMVGGIAGFRRLERKLLARGSRVIVIDPYHLSLDSADVSFAAMARRVDRVLTAHDVRRAVAIGHAHGAGVMLRVAAAAPHRFDELVFLDVGALARNGTATLSASIRLVPIVARVPGGRTLIRERFLRALRENSGRGDWLDSLTRDAYTEPMLADLDRVVALAIRLQRAEEPEPLGGLVARIRVPTTVVLGTTSRSSRPDTAEMNALAPLGAQLRITRLMNVGHFPHEEAPDELIRVLRAPQVTVATLR